MFPVERYELIMDLVNKYKFITIKELLRATKSSLTTLRRDINYLVNEGKIKKTRGGIQYVENIGLNSNNFLYKHREKLYQKEKVAIGIAAQDFIQEGDSVIITNGTTTTQVAKNIDENMDITVITNGIDIVYELRNKPRIKVILLGGIVDYQNNTIMGPTILKMLDEFNPSKIIMGAGGITEEKGVTIYDFIGATYFAELVKRVEKKIIVADHSKFGRNVLARVVSLNEINTVISDENLPHKYIDMLEKYHINYILAPCNQ